MRKSTLALIAVLFSVPWIRLSAQAFLEQSPQFTSARLSAIGGIHAGLADDITTLFSNPAGFRSAGPQFTVSEVAVHLAGPVFDLAGVFSKLSSSSNPAALLTDPNIIAVLTDLYTSFSLNGPISFGYVGNGLGFGFFNSTGIVLTTQGTLPTVSAAAQENLMFVGGFSVPIPLPDSMRSTLDLGVSLKLFAQGTILMSQSILSLLSIIQSGNPSALLNQPFNLDVGVGVDAGILYSWNKTISVGIVGRNLYTPVSRSQYASVTAVGTATPTVTYGIAPADLSAGVMYSPQLEMLRPYITSLKVMLDYSDILDFWTHPATTSNPILHVGTGIELTVLRILALRAGLGDGYFSAGAGVNLTMFQLDLAIYGNELSTEPGLRPVYNLMLGLEFRY
jgi:hypothetical protein